MLQAASTLPARQAADVILLGDEADLRARAVGLGLDLTGARIIDPATSELRERFAAEYARLRAHRGVTLDLAREIMGRSEEHTSELQSLMRNSYAVFCLKKKNKQKQSNNTLPNHYTHI